MTTTKREPVRTPEIIPRDYGTLARNVFVTPSRYAIGLWFISPQKEKYRVLSDWINHYTQQLHQGNPEVSKFSNLLFSTPQSLMENISLKVIEEKNSLRLIEEEEVINDAILKRRTLSGRVSSSREPGEEVLRNWLVTVKTPFFNSLYGVDYEELSCQCDDHQYDRGKRHRHQMYVVILVLCFRELSLSQRWSRIKELLKLRTQV